VLSGVPAFRMQTKTLTEVGLRENNEDAAFASPRLAAVADGVGGAAAGETASRLAILKMIALDRRRLEHPLEQDSAKRSPTRTPRSRLPPSMTPGTLGWPLRSPRSR
jgi:hypothetical protein